MNKEMKETVLKSVEYANENCERNNRRVRICNAIGMLCVAVCLLSKQSDIYEANHFVSMLTDLIQGFGIGILLCGLIMSSKYGSKIRTFKKRIIEKV